jgi:hypothetical protein
MAQIEWIPTGPGGASTAIQQTSTNTISYATINNQNNQYFIHLELTASEANNDDLRFMGCRIEYTMP